MIRFFFLYIILRNLAFLQSLPQDLSKLQRQIITAVSEISCDILQWVWAEMNCRLDIFRIRKGRHIEYLQSIQKTAWRISLSICRLHATFISAIEVYQFYEMYNGIMNNPVI